MARTKVEYSFPLRFWQQTPDFDAQYNAAEERFLALNQELAKRHMGRVDVDFLTFTVNGIPVVQKFSDVDWQEAQYTRSGADALELAKERGSRGQYSAEDLEAFLQGEGPVVFSEMGRLGFRRAKNDADKWVRVKRGEKPDRSEDYAHWDTLHGVDTEIVTGEEADRLRGLMPAGNVSTKPGETYTAEVGRQGLIYVAKDVNLFPTRPGQFLEEMFYAGHIDRHQEGFDLSARNVVLPSSQAKDLRLVHITAQKPDQSTQDFAWPVSTYPSILSDLAYNLRRKVTGR